MRQVLRAGALGRPREMGWRGRLEVELGWGTHVNPWLIHVNVWQKPLQYCNVISLQLIKINRKKIKKKKKKRQRNQRSNCQYPLDHRKSKRVQKKTSISALLTMPKPLTVWTTINCGKFQKRWEYQTTWPASWETCLHIRKPQSELDKEEQTGSKQEKEYLKAVYCQPAYLTYMQSTSWETLG